MPHDIFIVDDQHPEDLAMLQAMYSRSPASVVSHLVKLKMADSGKFMDQYYVGYGHASIGDCGATTCFIEQVSMLVAKAVQDNPLYNGQEASTRYLDYSNQSIIDPYDHKESASIQNKWMKLYNKTLPQLAAGLEQAYPFDTAAYKSEKIWRNALMARAFDIARSLLPIGTTTLLSWSTTLRAARDNLRRLKHHPLPEVREVAHTLFAKLYERYPHSFKGDEMEAGAPSPRDVYADKFAERDAFMKASEAMRRFALFDADLAAMEKGEIIVRRDAIDLVGLRHYENDTLASRPSGAPLPRRIEAYGSYNFLFLLDFGSFRDIQRHRNGVCPIPLIDGRFGIHPWYKTQFAAHLSADAKCALFNAIDEQFEAIKQLGDKGVAVSPLLSQYLYPMGTMGLTHVAYSVPETVYVGELRSGKTVHPSLRPVAQHMLKTLKVDFPSIALYGDMDEDSWTAKRGEQTISEKSA